MIIDSKELSFEDWARAVAQQLGLSGDTTRVEAGEDWREWVYRLMMLPQFAGQFVPRPAHFDDWRSWAEAFNLCMRY